MHHQRIQIQLFREEFLEHELVGVRVGGKELQV
jgi:hypothetical protein